MEGIILFRLTAACWCKGVVTSTELTRALATGRGRNLNYPQRPSALWLKYDTESWDGKALVSRTPAQPSEDSRYKRARPVSKKISRECSETGRNHWRGLLESGRPGQERTDRAGRGVLYKQGKECPRQLAEPCGHRLLLWSQSHLSQTLGFPVHHHCCPVTQVTTFEMPRSTWPHTCVTVHTEAWLPTPAPAFICIRAFAGSWNMHCHLIAGREVPWN